MNTPATNWMWGIKTQLSETGQFKNAHVTQLCQVEPVVPFTHLFRTIKCLWSGSMTDALHISLPIFPIASESSPDVIAPAVSPAPITPSAAGAANSACRRL
jgi:hypothetical protein